MSLVNQSMSFGFSEGGINTPPAVLSQAGNVSGNAAVVVPAGAANQPISLSFANTTLALAYWVATGNLTIKTNNATVPSTANQVFSFVANSPLYWANTTPANNPFTSNVSILYASNSGSANVTFTAKTLNT